MTSALPALCLRPFRLPDAEVVEPWFVGPGLSMPPGRAARDWAARMLAEPRILPRVAVVHDAVVAFARLDIGPDRIAELTLVVAPHQRRKGFGRAMLEALVHEARSRGVRRLQAVVDPSNDTALKFFSNNGFEESWAMPDSRYYVRLLHGAGSQEPLEIDV